MSNPKRYQRFQVFGLNGLLLAEGNERECAEQLGVNYNTFHTWLHNPGRVIPYRIVALPAEAVEKVPTPELAAAAAEWDRFITPIREAYGVPVYRPKKEKSE